MKIGIDCRLWNETGIGRYTRNLVKQLKILDQKNNYILFVLGRDRDEILKLVQNDKLKIVETDILWHTIREQMEFPKILNKENLDLVHFPYFSVPIFYNKAFVVTIHDLIPHHFSTGQASTLTLPIYNLKLLGYKFVINQAAKKAKKIIAVSEATKNEIIDHLKIASEKIKVIYEGVDDKLSRNWKLKIENCKFFLYVGNAYPHKNLERMLTAFARINDKGSRINLILVGKEDYFYKRLMKKTKEIGLSGKVILKQNVSDEELSSLYRNAKALILPSLMEGFGLPALEAMANNCLVLVSDIPSFKEVCGDAAIYFDPYNIEDILEKMKETCSNDTFHSDKKQKGLERAKLFSWRKMAEETLSVYKNAV